MRQGPRESKQGDMEKHILNIMSVCLLPFALCVVGGHSKVAKSLLAVPG